MPDKLCCVWLFFSLLLSYLPPSPPCFSPLFSEKQMLTEWKQIVQSPFEHSTLILGLLATHLHVWLSAEGLSCAANESSHIFIQFSRCILPGGSGQPKIPAVLPTPAQLCAHFSWPPVSAYLHLCFPGFGEQCECRQPNAGTENVTISLVLINEALISMLFCLCLAPAA